jgi:hypothetical protein
MEMTNYKGKSKSGQTTRFKSNLKLKIPKNEKEKNKSAHSINENKSKISICRRPPVTLEDNKQLADIIFKIRKDLMFKEK